MTGVAIVTAIVALAASLKLAVIAEGVETPEERDVLIALGLTSVQGWLWGGAVAADDAAWLLRDGVAPPRTELAVPRARVESQTLVRLGPDRAGGPP